MTGLKKKEIEKWNEDVYIEEHNKKDLVKYLIQNKKFKALLIDLLFFGLILRIYNFKGKLGKNFRNL